MGLVYRARDTRLNRDVALKVVAESFIEMGTPVVASHDRFLREARASSALNHPNICTLYDVGEQDGQPYLVMELLEGDTLKHVINGHAMPTDQLLDYGIQLCSALVEAHSHGILHRDIKPSNLFVTRRSHGHGVLKVLDFGIAKHSSVDASDARATFDETSSQGGYTLSGPGSTFGTVAYMAPERAKGEPVDARADVFSAGVVLYEMATGSCPFFGASIAEIFAVLLTQDPEPIRKRLPQFPRDLEQVIFKSLAKNPAERYNSAADLQSDLEQIRGRMLSATGAGLPSASIRLTGRHLIAREPRRIWKPIAAVSILLLLAASGYAAFFWWRMRPVPKISQADPIIVSDFINRTGEAAFDSTLRQSLSFQLQRSPLLDVVSDAHLRESLAFLVKPPDERITPAIAREIAQREGDKAVVSGSISSIGNEYLITLEAQNAATGDIFAREEAKAEGRSKVLGALESASQALRERMSESLPSIRRPEVLANLPTTPSMEAFRAYALGEKDQAQANFAQSVSAYQRAIELDPAFAMAYARMGVAYVAIGNQTEGNAAITRAFELSGKVSEQERLYIRVQYFLDVTGDLPQAIDTLKQYGQIYPNAPVVSTDLSVAYLTLGKYEEAYQQVQKAIALRPRSGSGYVNALLALTALNRFSEATQTFQTAESLGLADDASIRGTWIFTAYLTGDGDQVQKQLEWARDRTDGFILSSQMALIDEHEGRLVKAQADWQRAISLLTQQKMVNATASLIAQRTLDSALAGRCESAGAELERALKLDQDRTMQGTAAIAFGLCGQPARAQAIARALAKSWPQDTIINHVYLPVISAAVALAQNHSRAALDALQTAADYDTLGIGSYLRGLAHLALKDGPAAASDFNTPLGHRSIFVLSQIPGMNVAYPLSLLGVARASAIGGDRQKAIQQYDAFFAYWKNADPALPPLVAAHREASALRP